MVDDQRPPVRVLLMGGDATRPRAQSLRLPDAPPPARIEYREYARLASASGRARAEKRRARVLAYLCDHFPGARVDVESADEKRIRASERLRADHPGVAGLFTLMFYDDQGREQWLAAWRFAPYVTDVRGRAK